MAGQASDNGRENGAGKLSAWDVATAGTYADRCLPRPFFAAVLVVALVALLVPSVGMLWAPTDSTTENRELAPPPALLADDGSFNLNILADAGDYFDDHFAYRNTLVDVNARLRAALGTSATDQVVVGRDGWLYYGGTLPDFLGQSALSERALRNIAHNLALAQSYVEAQGATFAFALAPNKSTLYPSHMPYYYLRSPEASNAERLKPLLEDEGVRYVDLFALFGGEDGDSAAAGERYLLRDSHWDNRGALMVARELLGALGYDADDALGIADSDAAARDDFTGDLESMLFPASASTEVNWYFSGIDDGEGMSGSRWRYAEGDAVTDGWARTESGGEGSLLMFRDSFGNALDPFLSTAFGQAAFSKLVPYNLPQAAQLESDAVVIERAERHVGYLAENPPVMPAPRVQPAADLAQAVASSGQTTASVSADGPYWRIDGVADDGRLVDDSAIYVSIEGSGGEAAVYDASWKSVDGDGGFHSDFGYQVHFARGVLDYDAMIRVYALCDGVPICLKAVEFDPSSGEVTPVDEVGT